MRIPRLRFSIRTLLLVHGILAAVLGLTIRFGPHVAWRTLHADIASGVVPIPSRELTDSPALVGEGFVTCHVGPISFDVPASMRDSVNIRRGKIDFRDRDRILVVEFPQREESALPQYLVADFPKKAELSFPRLYKEIMDAKSSDFSFGMPRRELRWHQWLLELRAKIDVETVEFVWRADLEGSLAFVSSARVFNWVTVDRNWEGTILFKRSRRGDDWIRRVCVTFAVSGDPSVLRECDDAELQSMVRIIECERP